jgi:hypothetical protein
LEAQEARPLKEELMRKAFKVATVFTGTAACAAMFVPAAEAATAANAQQAEPATSHHNCAVGPRTTSTVLMWPSAAHHGPTCVGGEVDYRVFTRLGTHYSKICGGNNSGWITGPGFASPSFHGATAIHDAMKFTKGTGTFNLYDAYISSANISTYGGPQTCAT